MNSILLLEDEENLNRGISLKLEKEGYQVFSAYGVSWGMKLFQENAIDLIICDITLEDGNGLDFCREIRKISQVHFIFLTALDQEMDVVLGYEAGADDYMVKPFSLSVLISKVNAIFKRMANDGDDKIISGEVTFLKKEMKVLVKGEETSLTKNELRLLLILMENPKQILSKNQLLEQVFDINGEFVDENTVAVNIRRLREKIENDPSHPVYIRNVRGIGYLWDKEVLV
ncbi:MAG: response regulator transcription factor [Lachnospiraceae bacterium]|nr:response regulator transcription factor [Lachnospiraceae bacterium]MDE6759955.1 response regulator transcription factor [Lachnospiraceae bacterium]